MVALALHDLNTFTVIHGICYLLHLHSFGHLHCICLAQRGAEGVGDSQGWAQIRTQLGQILPHLGPHPKTPLGRAPTGILSPGRALVARRTLTATKSRLGQVECRKPRKHRVA
jgi:hypothetical protein